MLVKSYSIKPRYTLKNGLFVIDNQSIKFPQHFVPKQQAVVYIPPKKFGGNHQHKRTEVFVALGKELEIIWLENNKKLKKKMNPKGKLLLFKVESLTPHVIVNQSKTHPGILLEFTDTTFQSPAKLVKLI